MEKERNRRAIELIAQVALELWPERSIEVDTAGAGQSAAYVAANNEYNYLGVIPSYGLANARITLTLDNPDVERLRRVHAGIRPR